MIGRTVVGDGGVAGKSKYVPGAVDSSWRRERRRKKTGTEIRKSWRGAWNALAMSTVDVPTIALMFIQTVILRIKPPFPVGRRKVPRAKGRLESIIDTGEG